MSIPRSLSDQVRSLDDTLFNSIINIWPDDHISNAHIRPVLARMFGLKCGRHVQIRRQVYFEAFRRIAVGKNVFLNRQAYLDAGGGITIGDNVRLGPRVMLVTGTHKTDASDMRMGDLIRKPIQIEEGCWLGARVLVGPGVTIGRGSVVSAGSVVLRSMPAGFLIAGNPARPIARLDLPACPSDEDGL